MGGIGRVQINDLCFMRHVVNMCTEAASRMSFMGMEQFQEGYLDELYI
jgi:hypothetical protein